MADGNVASVSDRLIPNEERDYVAIFPHIERDERGNVVATKCRLDVEVVPDRRSPGGYKIKSEALFL